MRRSATPEQLHHKEGKHAEAEARAKDGLKRLGLAK